MFYQVTDNIAADCAAYDRWLADNEVPAATCTECGADGEYDGVNILYRVGDDELCKDCLERLYTTERGFEFAKKYDKDFARWWYPESDIDDGLAFDIWLDILQPKINAALKESHFHSYELWLLQEFTLDDSDAWCEWLNKNI